MLWNKRKTVYMLLGVFLVCCTYFLLKPTKKKPHKPEPLSAKLPVVDTSTSTKQKPPTPYKQHKTYEIKSALPKPNIKRINSTTYRYPDFLIGGVIKSGTETLTVMLKQHKDIYLPKSVKKGNCGVTDMDAFHYQYEYDPLADGKLLGEYANCYYEWVNPWPKWAYEKMPNVKIIFIIRNPVERSLSHFGNKYIFGNMEKQTNFDQFYIDSEGKIKNTTQFICHSYYVVGIKKWLEYYPQKNIFIIDGDAFRKNPIPQMKQVQKFLGIEDDISMNWKYRESRGFYCHVKRGCMPKNKGIWHPTLDPKVLEALREHYRSYNLELFKLLNRTFDWE